MNSPAPSSISPSSPRVSVVMPAHNVEAFINRAVHSALDQSMSDLELLVVDDGSKDNTVAVVEQIDDPRIRLIRKNNGGCASARNAGVQAARGTWISFLDGDDWWQPTKLERELACFEDHPEADMVFSLALLVDEAGNSLGLLKSNPARSFSFKDLLVENPVGNGSAVTIRATSLRQAGPFEESLPASSDSDMWLRLAKLRPHNIVCLPEIHTAYRRRRTQTTADWVRMEKAHALVLERASQLDAQAVDQHRPRALCNQYRYLAFIAYEAGDARMARTFLSCGAALARRGGSNVSYPPWRCPKTRFARY